MQLYHLALIKHKSAASIMCDVWQVNGSEISRWDLMITSWDMYCKQQPSAEAEAHLVISSMCTQNPSVYSKSHRSQCIQTVATLHLLIFYKHHSVLVKALDCTSVSKLNVFFSSHFVFLIQRPFRGELMCSLLLFAHMPKLCQQTPCVIYFSRCIKCIRALGVLII